jgi:hypothetical protein
MPKIFSALIQLLIEGPTFIYVPEMFQLFKFTLIIFLLPFFIYLLFFFSVHMILIYSLTSAVPLLHSSISLILNHCHMVTFCMKPVIVLHSSYFSYGYISRHRYDFLDSLQCSIDTVTVKRLCQAFINPFNISGFYFWVLQSFIIKLPNVGSICFPCIGDSTSDITK